MLLVETILALMAVILAFAWPTLGASWFERAEGRLAALARRQRLAIIVIGGATLLLRIAVLPVAPIPNPSVHDEFSYLLQADTFAHGRLTNPTPSMWMHFETFHEIFQPTYCSKFFPGQGLFLALGKVVFGHPFWGVWLTSGLMCAAITWMLQGWFSSEWAFLGGALTLLRFGVFGYWANSYWGGNVAAIGGALVLGALPRIMLSVRWHDATLMGIGLALLANSRPWEGLVLSLPATAMLLAWMFGKNHPPFAASMRGVVLPLVVVLGLTGGWLAYYCWRTTGSPMRTPYQVYEKAYGAIPVMIWQKVRPEPSYRHPVLRKLEIEQELVGYRSFRTPVAHMLRIFSAVSFFLGPILLLPFLVLTVVLPYGFSFGDISNTTRVFLIVVLVFIAGTELAIFYNPHYSAPITALVVALTLVALGKVRDWSASGRALGRAVTLGCLIAFLLRVTADPLRLSRSRYSSYYWNQFFELHPNDWFPRTYIYNQLLDRPGDHIVIVRYMVEHEPFPDWVYNDADIDNSKVIWARDMGLQQNKQLLGYYARRHAWLLEADASHPQLVPYFPESSSKQCSDPLTVSYGDVAH
jgi:hypothetical protein